MLEEVLTCVEECLLQLTQPVVYLLWDMALASGADQDQGPALAKVDVGGALVCVSSITSLFSPTHFLSFSSFPLLSPSSFSSITSHSPPFPLLSPPLPLTPLPSLFFLLHLLSLPSLPSSHLTCQVVAAIIRMHNKQGSSPSSHQGIDQALLSEIDQFYGSVVALLDGTLWTTGTFVLFEAFTCVGDTLIGATPPLD